MPDFRLDTFSVTSAVLMIVAAVMILALLVTSSPAEPEPTSTAPAQQGVPRPAPLGATSVPPGSGVAPSPLAMTRSPRLRDEGGGSEGVERSRVLPPDDLNGSHVMASGDLPDTATAISGSATWLCDPPTYKRCTKGYNERRMVAARGSELPRAWQGKIVTVSWRGRSVDVRLVDTCKCKGVRIIDLYAAPFRRLCACRPEVIGVLRDVSVTLKGSARLPFLPPTSTVP
jgi:hypothetical protein